MDEIKNPRNSRWKRIILAVCLLLFLGGAAAGYWYYFMRGLIFSDDARLDGELLDLASQISGTLTDVFVKEGDQIRQGELLFELDNRPLIASFEKAKADVESAEAELAIAKAEYDKCLCGPRSKEIDMAVAAEHRAATQARLAAAEWERVKRLENSRVITDSVYDKIRTDYEAARYAHKEAKTRLDLLREGTRTEDLSVAKAKVQLNEAKLISAKTEVRMAEINLEHAKVHAPFDGVVVRRWQNPGALMPAGRPVLTIFNPTTLHVSANIEEKHLSKVTLGAQVDISVDAYPDISLTGHVDKILQATNSQFSFIPADGSSGSFIKVAQRVPIRVSIDADPQLFLGPGLSVEIRIHTSGELTSAFTASASHE